MNKKYYMNFEDSQDYIQKRGLDVPWNDCDIFIDERAITRTVGNVLLWADEHPKTIEMKDVDLEKEIDDWYNNIAHREFTNVHYDNIEQCAKYFFNLGLKAQKGEKV